MYKYFRHQPAIELQGCSFAAAVLFGGCALPRGQGPPFSNWCQSKMNGSHMDIGSSQLTNPVSYCSVPALLNLSSNIYK